MPIAASAQQTPKFTRPAVTLRVGAVPTMNETAGGLAPYLEAQSKVNLGETPFGLALYGGIAYEQLAPRTRVCITGPCFQGYRTHLDLATGLRIGVFPRNGPVDVFIGLAPHLLRRTTEGGNGANRRWDRYSVVEAGTSVQVPVTRRLSMEAGVRADLLLHTAADDLFDSDDLMELGRYVVHLGVQYEL